MNVTLRPTEEYPIHYLKCKKDRNSFKKGFEGFCRLQHPKGESRVMVFTDLRTKPDGYSMFANLDEVNQFFDETQPPGHEHLCRKTRGSY